MLRQRSGFVDPDAITVVGLGAIWIIVLSRPPEA
jgi:hypothetical protein